MGMIFLLTVHNTYLPFTILLLSKPWSSQVLKRHDYLLLLYIKWHSDRFYQKWKIPKTLITPRFRLHGLTLHDYGTLSPLTLHISKQNKNGTQFCKNISPRLSISCICYQPVPWLAMHSVQQHEQNIQTVLVKQGSITSRYITVQYNTILKTIRKEES